MDQLFMWAVGTLLGCIIALVGFIVNFILKSQKSNDQKTETMIYNLRSEFHVYKLELTNLVTSIKKDQDEIKYNYLKRFEIVNNNIHSVKEEIVNKIHDLHTAIIEKDGNNS